MLFPCFQEGERKVHRDGYVEVDKAYYQVPEEYICRKVWVRWDSRPVRVFRPDLLIIDDMGLKQLPRKSGEYLFEVIMRRYENRSTIMTLNRSIEEWGKLVGDVPAATAILDRFLHHAEFINITGKSYRLKEQACKKASKE